MSQQPNLHQKSATTNPKYLKFLKNFDVGNTSIIHLSTKIVFNSNKNCNFHFIVHTHSVVQLHDDDMRDDNQGISFIDVTYIGIPVCTITTYEDYSVAVLNSVLFSLFSVVLFSLSTHDTI